MLFGKYYLITTNFRSVLLLLYMHTEISCFDVKSSTFNNASNASFGKEKQVKADTSLHSTKDLLPTKSQQDIQTRKQFTAISSYTIFRQSRTKLVGTDVFALKEAFPVCKLLPFTANTPCPPLQCWLLKEDILVNPSMTFPSAFNIAMGGGGGGSQLETSSKIQSVS